MDKHKALIKIDDAKRIASHPLSKKYGYAVIARLWGMGIRNTNFHEAPELKNPENRNHRMVLRRPLMATYLLHNPDEVPEMTRVVDYAVCFADLVDAGFVEHGYWRDGGFLNATPVYGFSLTNKAMDVLAALSSPLGKGEREAVENGERQP